MSQNPEAQAFIERISALPSGPGISLHNALEPSLHDETELRRLFATDRAHPRLADPHVGLVDLFDAPPSIRTTRARVIDASSPDDLSAHHVMPLSDSQRRTDGAPATAADLDEFRKNWAIFTENAFSQLVDWSNVVAAGGAVLACLAPLPEHAKASKRSIRKHYHAAAYPTSDIDLFLWGLTPEQAEARIVSIYEAVRDSVPWDVTCLRTKHTVSIHSQYPYRAVQIVLRLYASPAEVLAGFDVDAPCCAYDGRRVWASPRAVAAMMRQCNTVDMTRRSPSYEARLAKYAARGFEVHIPSLRRADVDPTIYERAVSRITGLARLLVLERLTDSDARAAFLGVRRQLRGRPAAPPRAQRRRNRRTHKGDLKGDGLGLEMNDYDVAALHVPYGPGWDARRIEKLVYQTDLGMNSTFNPKNKGRTLHRHPAFFGTMAECLEDCCGHCPEALTDEDEKLQKDEDASYIRGRISFIQDNPGRQILSGSFRPVDVGEWSEQVYVGATQLFFAAIAAQDRAAVCAMLNDGRADANRRDHAGRTPLHAAICAGAAETACDLVDLGARLAGRLADGRTALHLAAQRGLGAVVRKLLERSAANAVQAAAVREARGEDAGAGESDGERPSSEDDWSSEDGGCPPKKPVGKPQSTDADEPPGTIPEDELDTPDVLDVNLPDWDLAFTPLAYAIVAAAPAAVALLLAAGADPTLATKADAHDAPAFHPLALTLLVDDRLAAAAISETLIAAGASCSAAGDDNARTIFHRAVAAGKTHLVSTWLRHDANAAAALNLPVVGYSSAVFPVVLPIAGGDYATLALLLAHGAQTRLADEEVTRAWTVASKMPRYGSNQSDYHNLIFTPGETAVARHDEVIHLLMAIGVDVNQGIKQGFTEHLTLLDSVRSAITTIGKNIAEVKPPAEIPGPAAAGGLGWAGYLRGLQQNITHVEAEASRLALAEDSDGIIRNLRDMQDYFVRVEALLLSHGAKTWDERDPRKEDVQSMTLPFLARPLPAVQSGVGYALVNGPQPWHDHWLAVPQHLVPLYDELYEACFTGDNRKIQELCLPADSSQSACPPLQMAVKTVEAGNVGCTPLLAAISGRQWNTAKLIVAILAAQYAPEEDLPKFDTSDVSLDDGDSDNGSDISDDSDATVEGNPINFTDVATRQSAIRCRTSPSFILELQSRWTVPSEKKVYVTTPLMKSAVDGDLEAFKNIAALYDVLPEAAIPTSDLTLNYILEHDRVDILDEYIRRTGSGLDIPAEPVERDVDVDESTNKSNTYLGLSVHGKKRKDLAGKNDPDAQTQLHGSANIPLLWKAIQHGARGIVDYLSGDRPLAAYKFFSTSSKTKLAEQLRCTANLPDSLPKWLGWTNNGMHESALTAAVLAKDLEIMKKLVLNSPRMMGEALHDRFKFLRYNHLMLALDMKASIPVIDFLLQRGVSVTDTDFRGCNLFHILCFRGHAALLEHMLQKLPRDTTQSLLAQQSKKRQNTPLHIAAKTGMADAVKTLMQFGINTETLLLRDVDGSTPLHAAVNGGFPAVTQSLVDGYPKAGLYLENGVGETALEITSRRELLLRTRTIFNKSTIRNDPPSAPHVISNDPQPCFNLEQQQRQIPRLRAMVDTLIYDGRLQPGTKVADELLAFTDMMEKKLTAAAANRVEVTAGPFGDVNQAEKVYAPESVNRMRVLDIIRNALAAKPGMRGLVHLIDAQTAVEGHLRGGKDDHKDWRGARSHFRRDRRFMRMGKSNEDGLEPEMDEADEMPQRTSRLLYSAYHVWHEMDK